MLGEGKCMVNAGQTKEMAQIGTEFRKQIGGIWWVFSTANFHKKRPNPPPFH